MAERELPVQIDDQRKGPVTQGAGGWPNGYAYPEMGGYAGETSEEANIDVREILRVLLKRKKLIGISIVVTLALGFLWIFLQKPLYTAAIRFQIDKSARNILDDKNASPGEVDYTEDYIATELELLKGRNLAERVATRLHLGNERVADAGDTKDRTERDRAAADGVLYGVSVKRVAGTRLVDISFTDSSPSRAQAIANAYGDVYVASNLDKRFQANAYAKSFLEDQVRQLKLRLEEAERAMISFAEKEQIVVTTDKASVAESNLAAANAALGQIIADRIKQEQLWRQAESAVGMDLPQLLTNQAIQDLRGRRGQLVAEYQEKSQTFRSNYPEMMQLSGKIKEIEHQIGVEVKTVKASLKAAYEGAINQENQMKERIEKLRQETLDLQKRSVQYNILKREVDSTRALYENLLQRYKEVDVASGVGTNNVFIVERALLPASPSSPNRPKAMLIALVLGLVIGVSGAFALEHLDDVVHDPAEAEKVSGLTLHGVIPRPGSDTSFEDEAEDPRSAVSEAFRSTCTSLQFSTEAGAPKTLVVTSSGPGEGKSSVAFSLANKFAALGLRLLVIDADLRKPSLHQKAQLDNSIGLSNYLTHNCELGEAIRQIEATNVHIMSAGPTPPNPVELLNGARFASLVSSSGEVFDMVIIDGPPVMGMADALVLGNIAKATIFVVAAGQGRVGLIRNALKRLRRARVSPLGMIVTKYDPKKAGFGGEYGYGYGYGYGYAYGYGSEPEQIPGANASKTQENDKESLDDGSAAA